jgi:hypothetical protein
MRILHIAPYNTAGVPLALCLAERELGHDSRLVTLYRGGRGYLEDICLNLPFWSPRLLAKAKKMCYPEGALAQDSRRVVSGKIPPVWRPANPWAALLIGLRDRLTLPLVELAVKKHRLDEFDHYQLDGGHGFLRRDVHLSRWHGRGSRVACCYLGSDLRRRGVIPGIEAISDCNLTMEWDHLDLHPRISHVFFPFDASGMGPSRAPASGPVRIGHSPTNRAAKGSTEVIRAVRRLSEKRPVELVLIEGLPHRQALELKATCHIGVDQLGELGYGISALEWLAMGIPVASSIAGRMKSAGIEHPLVEIGRDDIEQKLEAVVADRDLRLRLGNRGREWLEQYHHPIRVAQSIHQLTGVD